MRTMIAILMVAASTAWGQLSPYKVQSATGTTNAVVYWPLGSAGFNLESLDVTSDKSTSVATWRVGAAPSMVAVAAGATLTNVTVLPSTLASNDVVLMQNAAGSIVQRTVYSRTATTNGVVRFVNPLGTNLAVGDTLSKKANSFRTVFNAASNATTLYLDTTNGLVAGRVTVGEIAGRLAAVTVSSYAQAYSYSSPLVNPAPRALTPGDAVYVRSSTSTTVLAAHANESSHHVAASTGFNIGDKVLLECSNGSLAVKTVDSVATTNITLTAASGVTLGLADRIYLLASATTAKLPSLDDATSISLTASNGFIAGAIAVAVPTTGAPWTGKVKSAATRGWARSVALGAGIPAAWNTGTALWTATNSHVLTRTAASTEAAAVVLSATGLSAGDYVVIQPASGGSFVNAVSGVETGYVLNQVNFTAAHGIALSVGDSIYATTTITTPVGSATLRLNGPAVFIADPGRPAALSVDGTTTCAINSAVVHYH